MYRNKETISDLKIYPQDIRDYITEDFPLCETYVQKKLCREYREKFLSPWVSQEPLNLLLVKNTEALSALTTKYLERNLQYTRSFVDSLEKNFAEISYPNASQNALTNKNTYLRSIPWELPVYNDFTEPGEGYPFDCNLYSLLLLNTPVKIWHVSLDKIWCFCQTSYTYGWVKRADLCPVNTEDKAKWREYKWITITKDFAPLADTESNVFEYLCLGCHFPLIEEREKNYKVLMAWCDKIIIIDLAKTVSTHFPLSLTSGNMSKIISELQNQPYGWGGLHQQRDCSSMLMDLFAVFGIWLPRNGNEQEKYLSNSLDVSDLNNVEKEQKIKKEAKPFLSIIRLKGHVMLYIGTFSGSVVIFHNIWGIKTRDKKGNPGRFVIGRSVFTSLSPGKELPDFDLEMDILQRVSKICHVF